MWGALSDERTGLSFTIAVGTRHSRVRVPRDTSPYFTVSDSRFPQPGGPGFRIYIPQEQGSPVIPPGTIPFSSPPATRRATVEVFEPAYTRGKFNIIFGQLNCCWLCQHSQRVSKSDLLFDEGGVGLSI
jgi:hypothetical protein